MRKVIYFAILLDAVSTIIGIHYYGLNEANPLFNWLIFKIGLVNAMILGAAVSALVMEFMYKLSESKMSGIPRYMFLLVLIAKIAVGVNNSIMIII